MTDLPPLFLGPMPAAALMHTVDEQLVRAPLARILALASNVEGWPALLPHYRFVRFLERRSDGGGIVDMSANRPFGPLNWPTWWRSRMAVLEPASGLPSLRFAHVEGITRGMEVEWSFEPRGDATWVRVLHLWNGPPVPAIGSVVAELVIGPVFVHGIASRTLAGLALHAERAAS
ncbi:MAG: hypothetical protein H0W68_14415 [Gemmatimonadaceae bacterium]|nr:hypothetical protein [Gemmatimonadaceae bacterium]